MLKRAEHVNKYLLCLTYLILLKTENTPYNQTELHIINAKSLVANCANIDIYCYMMTYSYISSIYRLNWFTGRSKLLWEYVFLYYGNMTASSNGNIFRVTGRLCGPVPGEFPAQRPVTRSIDVFFDLRMNKRLSKQSWCCWFETLSRPLWRHRNEILLASFVLIC